MKLVHIAPTSFPTNLGTGGAEKVAFEFDSLMHDQVDMLTIAHPNTNTSVFKGPVTAESLDKRNRDHVLSIIEEGGFDTALVHMTRTKELRLALELEIPCSIIVHIAPEIAGHMTYDWMDLMAQCLNKNIPIYAVSKTHAARLTKAFHSAREYAKRKLQDLTALCSASEDVVFDKYILTHHVSSELIKPVLDGDGSLCTVSRISAAAPPDKLFFFHDEFDHPVKLITNMSNIISAKDMAAHEKYFKKYGELFRIDLDRESVINEVRASSATINPIAIDSSPCKVFESNALGVPVIIFDNRNSQSVGFKYFTG